MCTRGPLRLFPLLIVLCLVISTPYCAAQYVPEDLPEPASNTHDHPAGKKYKNQVKFSPIRVFDPINPGFEVSYERAYGRFSSQLAAAVLADPFTVTDNDQYTGVRLAIEEKYFFGRGSKVRPYVAMEMVAHKIDIRRHDLFTDDPRSWRYNAEDSLYAEPYVDDYRIEKSMFTISGKVGLQAIFGRFVLDFGYGLGLKWRTVEHFDRMFPSDRFARGIQIGAKDGAYREGCWKTMAMPLNLKVGFLF